jgi:flagellar motility protein MotE (MotC chaperone)
MSVKTIGLYSGFFAGMLLVALFVTGVFQQGILPRFSGAGKEEPKQRHETESGAKGPGTGATARAPMESATDSTPSAEPSEPLATAPARQAAAHPAGGAAEAAADAGAPVKRLSRMYEGMRAKEAAGVLEKLERPFAAQVLAEISPRHAAKILAAMTPAAAAELTRLLGQPGGKSTT